QETFLQVHRARRTYRIGSPVRPWAFGIARHVFLMSRRSAARRFRREAAMATTETPARPSPDETVIQRDELDRALVQLSHDRREAVVLHHLFGFPFSEIGRRLGIRADTAKVRASRGIASLRALMARREPPK